MKTHTIPMIVASVLDKIGTKYNGLPDLFAGKLVLSTRKTSRLVRVSMGKASFLYEHDATISPNDPKLNNTRFDAFHSYDIPRLSQGRAVRYYINKDLGRRGWDVFIATVRKLENQCGEEFLSDLEELMLRGK